ncbi:M20/M25/M40 family metallo-hydrolase [Tepidiforma sp.]|uniref:M20/M25/M40 family metallo-hydrolase n=1 Tax=Tepidiforma sp. TaxID=2682230 RepID=UPI002ADDE0EA|nr:M20/M25/M40 family metallo-hydrolase [Tepidiforma sp.]
MITRDRAVQTFLDLVAIDSPSGHEDAIAAELEHRLRQLGLQTAQDAAGNVLARLDGQGEPILLSAHMDTVEPGRGIRPQWDGPDIIRSDGTTILGADDKAGCAVILEVLQSLLEDGLPHRPVEVAISRGEEIGLIGATNLDYRRITARVAIVVDSGGPPSSIQGQAPYHYVYDIEVYGRSAHAGLEPEKGIPAISIAAELVTSLPQGRLDPETTGNVGIIRGGLVRNAVPETCLVQGEFRSMVQERAETLARTVRRHVEAVQTRHPGVHIQADIRMAYPGYRLEPDDPAAALLFPILRSLGFQPNPHPVGGGTDGNVFRGHGIASLVIGRGGYNQHTKDEYLVVPEMLDCARVVEAACRSGIA